MSVGWTIVVLPLLSKTQAEILCAMCFKCNDLGLADHQAFGAVCETNTSELYPMLVPWVRRSETNGRRFGTAEGTD